MENAATAPAQAPPETPETKITDQEVEEILYPELSKDRFTLMGREYSIRVLPWKWERAFRAAALPLIEQEFKPFEKIMYSYATELHMLKEDMALTESFIDTEKSVDSFLTAAVVVICVAQDAEVLKHAAAGTELPLDLITRLETKYRIFIENAPDLQPSPRLYLREIVRKQMEKHEMVQRLGESLMARLGECASLAGARKDFDSLRADFMQQARSFLASVGKRVSTSANSFIPPMGNSRGISIPSLKPPPTTEKIDKVEVAPATQTETEATASAQTSG